MTTTSTSRILVAGVCLADQPNSAAHVVEELSRATRWNVDHRWIGIGRAEPAPVVSALTVFRTDVGEPKFLLLNRLLSDMSLTPYEYLLICDDDVTLPRGFLDSFMQLVVRHDFGLAQPARTSDSYIDHWFVQRLDGLSARRTRFVEIGPLVLLRRDLFPLLMPFDEQSPMGWGYDLAWPVILEQHGLKMGIVDAIPVGHTLRKPVQQYDRGAAEAQMREYLHRNAHLPLSDACFIIEPYL